MIRAKGRNPKLSKSRYVSGLQCQLKLWNQCFARDLAQPMPEADHRIELGRRVGLLATQRHPGGVMINSSLLQHMRAVEHTRLAMADEGLPALFEPAFVFNDVRVRVDLLQRLPGNRWNMIEVKSASRVKDVNIDDLAIQYWVLRGAGVAVAEAGILTINREYVYDGGDYDVDELFVLRDMTGVVRAKADEVAANVATYQSMLARRLPPDIVPGEHCSRPWRCEFWNHCARDYEPPNHTQKEQVSDGLASELEAVIFPVYHLDFEACMMALPRYVGTRPYQVLPFQWSIHVEHGDGRLEHHEYLCRDDCDPRPQLVEELIEVLGEAGTICTYSPFETRILRELADAFPELRARIMSAHARCWDLQRVIRRNITHPSIHGSISIKRALPLLAPGIDYGDLEIKSGYAAALAYEEALTTDDRQRRTAIHASLLTYCGRDTEAMVRLCEGLRRRVV